MAMLSKKVWNLHIFFSSSSPTNWFQWLQIRYSVNLEKVEFHFKKLNRKTDQKCRKVLHKTCKLQTCLKLKGRKVSGRALKSPPNWIIWITTINNNFRRSRCPIKTILIDIFSCLHLLKTQSFLNHWSNQETMVEFIIARGRVLLMTDKPIPRDRFWTMREGCLLIKII